MSEQHRRLNNRDRVLAYLRQHGKAKNWELIQVGGMRAMGRVHELRATHVLDVRRVQGGEWEIVYHGPRAVTQLPLEMGA